MPVASGGIQIENLAAFRRALREARSSTPRDLTAALKRAGIPLVAELHVIAPVGNFPDPHPGLLRGSYGVSVRGVVGSIISRAAYGAGAEWGQHGKWSGFMQYGGPGRFAAKVIDEREDQIVEDVFQGLTDVVHIYGWATE
jgi:hypothetical protein